MTLPILKQKITPPSGWPGALPRRAFAQALDRAISEGQHVALVAGSGYGKSTALAEWARAREAAWLTLDAEDADLDGFLAYMIAAFEQALPGFRTEARAMLGRARERDGAMAALSALLADLDEQGDRPLVLVLDDYHLAASPSLDAMLMRMIKYLPAPIRLVVASRKAPDLELSGLRARRALALFGESELAFTANELAQLRPEADAEAIAEALEATGGWPAATALAPELLEAYIDEQVLADTPTEIREFLQRASLVDWFDAELCTSALGTPLTGELRARLLSDRLALAADGGRYVVPQPLRGLLRRRFLAETSLEARSTLLHAIGQHQWNAGAAPTALRFWIEAGEAPWAAEKLEAVTENWLAEGRLEALASALDALGAHADRPALRLAEGEVFRRWGDFDRAAERFEQALAACEARSDASGAARVRLRQALAMASRGQVEAARLLLESARGSLDGSARLAIEVENLEGGLALFANQTDRAVAHYEASLRLSRRAGDPYAEARAIHNMGVCLTRLGEFRRALECYDAAMAPVASDGTPTVWMTPINRALILIYLDRAPEALEAAQGALALVRRYKLAREEGYALRILGFAHQRLGQLGAAEGAYEAAELLSRRTHDTLGVAYSLNFQADLALARGEAASALRRTDEIASLVGGDEGLLRIPELAQVRAKALLAVGRRDEAAGLIDVLADKARGLGNPQLSREVAELAAELAGAASLERVVPVAVPELPAELAMRCLGGLRVFRAGAEVGEREWQSARAKLLLAFLLHTPEGALKGRLFELLYPGEETTNASLNMNLMRLRKVLEPALDKGQPSRYILRNDGRYAFNHQLAFSLDTRAFDAAVRAARQADGTEAIALAWRALDLYGGDFLPEFDNDWVLAMRLAYRDKALAVCRRLLDLAPDDEVALAAATRALEIDPLSEEFNREVILRHLEADEPHRALQHYQLCARRFEEQLKSSPPEDLSALVAGL